jgi:serine/threonine-protein kinase
VTASRWDRLEDLLDRANQLAASERAAFIETETAGEPELRAELAALLDASPDAEQYLERLREELLGPDVQDILREGPSAADAPDPWIGRSVSHYEILDRIGGGGMGVIYRARDVALGRPVAIKFIAPEIRRDPQARDRFMQEARAASALDHPNICTIHEIAETEDGRLYIVMTAYDGETLRERLGRGPLSEDEAVDIGVQVARALAAAHEHGIVHRDVKPDNVILTRDGVAKLLDFGLARTGDGWMGAPGAVEGTVAYMSPEQVEGRPADARSDVWALGVMLFEMLAGVRPFAAADPRVAIDLILSGGPELALPRADITQGIVEIFHRAVAKSPEHRFADGGEILVALQEQRAAAASARRVGGRRRRRILAAALVALLVAGGFVGLRVLGDAGPVRVAGVAGVLSHVLWVDDNPGNNEEVVRQLDARGVEVTTALSSAESMRVYDPAVHQLVVSDIGRYEGPGDAYVARAGLDLLTRLKGRDDDVKLVFCTGTRAANRYRREALASGAVGVFDDCGKIFR